MRRKKVCFEIEMHFSQDKVFSEHFFFVVENRVVEDPPSQLNGKLH